MAGFDLKSIVPEIFIDRVILENQAVEVADYNPHIDHEREAGMYKDETTGKIKRKEMSPDLAKASQGSDTLCVSIDFVVRDKLENNVLAAWFDMKNNKGLLKYYKVRIIQSMDENLTNELLQAPSLVSVTKDLSQEMVFEDLSLQDIIGTKVTTDFTTVIDDFGGREYEIPFFKKFVIKNASPKHLAFFSVCYIDFESLMKDYELGNALGGFGFVQGKVHAEMLIQDYSTTSVMFVFVDENGEVWSGPVLKEESKRETKVGDRVVETSSVIKWYANIEGGNTATKTEKRYLELKTIPNTKVQDFRHARQLEKQILDFSIVDNEILRTANTGLAFPDRDIILKGINQNKAYFSDLKIARDKDGNVRFFFGVDMISVARDHAVFANLFHLGNTELLNYIKVRSLKVIRVRIKSNNNGVKDVLGISEFNKDDPRDLIAISGEKESFDFITSEVENGKVREVVLAFEPGVRFFTGIDKNMSAVTYGIYQYGVEMELEDNTIKFLNERMDVLLESYETLKQYSNEASDGKNFNSMLNRFSLDFIEEKENLYSKFKGSSPWNMAISAYLGVLKVFVPKLEEEKYSQSLLLFLHPRTGSLDAISMVIKMFETLILKMVTITNMKSSRFVSGDGSSVDTVVKMRGSTPASTIKIEKYFNTFHDSDTLKNIGFDYLFASELDKEVNDDGLAVISQIRYEKRVEAETVKYFSDVNVDINLKTAAKQLTVDDSLMNTKYSFLTPSIVDLKGVARVNTLDRGNGLFETGQYEKLTSNILAFNSMKRSPQMPLKSFVPNTNSPLSSQTQEVKSNLSNVFSLWGVSIEKDITKTAQPFCVVASNIIGTGSNFNKETSTQLSSDKMNLETNVSNNPNSFLLAMIQPEIKNGFNSINASRAIEKSELALSFNDKFNLNSSKNILENGLVGVNPGNKGFAERNVIPNEDKIKNLPNQIKSLFVGSVNPSSVNYDWFGKEEDIFSNSKAKLGFQMNYNIINQIEVFQGFEKTLVPDETYVVYENHMRQEIWASLTAEMFNSNVNKNMLCRMKPYINKQFGVGVFEGIELPTYNEYFIISPKDKIMEVSPPIVSNDMKVSSVSVDVSVLEKFLSVDTKKANTLVADRIPSLPSSAHVKAPPAPVTIARVQAPPALGGSPYVPNHTLPPSSAVKKIDRTPPPPVKTTTAKPIATKSAAQTFSNIFKTLADSFKKG